VRQEQCEILPTFGDKGIARFPDSRSGIDQQNIITIVPNFQAGRIAAIAQIIFSGNRDGASGPPTAYDHRHSFVK